MSKLRSSATPCCPQVKSGVVRCAGKLRALGRTCDLNVCVTWLRVSSSVRRKCVLTGCDGWHCETAAVRKLASSDCRPSHIWRVLARVLFTGSHKVVGTGVCGSNSGLRDLWENDAPATSFKPNSACSTQSRTGCKYLEEVFEKRVNDTIAAHDAATPLFLMWSPHSIHLPLAPPAVTDPTISAITHAPRRLYMATVKDIDT
jgi:hypothetical protein